MALSDEEWLSLGLRSVPSQQKTSPAITQSVPQETTRSSTSLEFAILSDSGSSPTSSQQENAFNATLSVPNGTVSNNTSAPNPTSLRDQSRHLDFDGYCSDEEKSQKSDPRLTTKEVYLMKRNEMLKERQQLAERYYYSPRNPSRPPRRGGLTAGSRPTEDASSSNNASIAPVSGQIPPSESSVHSPSSLKPDTKPGNARGKHPRRHHGPLNPERMHIPSPPTSSPDTISLPPDLKLRAKKGKYAPFQKNKAPTHGPSQGSSQPKPKPQSPTPPDETLTSPDSTPGVNQSTCKYGLERPTHAKGPSQRSSLLKPTPHPPSSPTPSDENSSPSDRKSDVKQAKRKHGRRSSQDDNRLCVKRKPSQGSLRREPRPSPAPAETRTPPAERRLCIEQGKWRLPHDRSCATIDVSMVCSQHVLAHAGSPSPSAPQGASQSPPQSPPQNPLQSSSQGVSQSLLQDLPPSPPPSPSPAPPESCAAKLLTQALSDLLTPKPPPTPLRAATQIYKQHIRTLRAQRTALTDTIRERTRLQKQLEKSDASQRMLRNLECTGTTMPPEVQRQMRIEAVRFRTAHYQEKEGKLLKQLNRVSRSAVHMRRNERALLDAVSFFSLSLPSAFSPSFFTTFLALILCGRTGEILRSEWLTGEAF